jgi:hypothetical protein
MLSIISLISVSYILSTGDGYIISDWGYPIYQDIEAEANVNKCIVSWKVIQMETTNEDIYGCSFVNLIINWDEWQYNLTAYSPNQKTSPTCFWWYKSNMFPLPKIWDNVELLIDKDTYKVISWEKISNWEYKFSYYVNSVWNFEVCEPNVWEDTELQKKIREWHTYLNELYDEKPKLVKLLLEPLKQAVLSDKLELEIRNLASAFWKIVYNF